MSLEILDPQGFRVMPWRNGGGVTTELVIDPPEGSVAEGFDYRLSMATVGTSGPFSAFPGMDRTLLLLEGRGLQVDFGPHGSARLERVLEPVRFSGDWSTHGTILDGPCRDFNVITRRSTWRHGLSVMSVAGIGVQVPACDCWLGYVVQGSLEVQGQCVSEGSLIRATAMALSLSTPGNTAILIAIRLDRA